MLTSQPSTTCRLEPMPPDTDLVVVGAGIIGLAHAFEAQQGGHRVVVLDRDDVAVGASVRNFGHACVTAQPKHLRELALNSRDGWLRAAAVTGLPVAEDGAVALADSDAAHAVLEELSDRRPDDVHLLTRADVDRAVGGLPTAAVRSGALLRHDLRVDPRTAVGHLAGWLQEHGVTIARRRHVQHLDRGSDGRITVTTNRGSIRADRVMVCVGHDLDHLFPALTDGADVQRCALQMTRLAGPGVPIRPAVLTATSMLRYGAFAEVPAWAALERHVQQQAPGLLVVDANVMLTQLPDGSLVVGDSHLTEPTTSPFLSAPTDTTLRQEMNRLLAIADLPVLERWQGVYATSPQTDVLDVEPLPGVRVITVTSGVGMTLSFGIARRTLGVRDHSAA